MRNFRRQLFLLRGVDHRVVSSGRIPGRMCVSDLPAFLPISEMSDQVEGSASYDHVNQGFSLIVSNFEVLFGGFCNTIFEDVISRYSSWKQDTKNGSARCQVARIEMILIA